MPAWLQQDWCSSFVLTLGHFVWQGTLVAIVLAIVLRTVKSVTARYWLSLAALLVMAACPIVTLGWLMQPMSPIAESDVRPIVRENAASPRSVETGVMNADDPRSGLQNSKLAGHESRRIHDSTSPILIFEDPTPAPTAVTDPSWWQEFAPHLTTAYLSGVALMLLRLVAGLWGGRRLRRRVHLIDNPSLVGAMGRQATALGLKLLPILAYCERVTVPTVVGVLKPMILLPLTLTSGLSPEQIESVLAHELAHLRRCDHLVNLLQRVIESLLFFHPAMWWVSQRIREEREHCCDDLVVACGAMPLDYAKSLLRVAELSRTSKLRRSVAAVSLLATGDKPSSLRQRIARLLGESATPSLRVSPRVLVTSITVLLIGLAMLIQLGVSSDQPTKAPGDEVAAKHPPLEFRIAVTNADRDKEGTAWFPIIKPRIPAPAEKSGADVPIEEKLDDQWRGLLWDNAEHALLADGTWKVVKCDIVKAEHSTDDAPRFDIQIQLDKAGGALMRRLTTAHQNQKLAIVVDGAITAVPTLRAEIGESCVLTGDFTKAIAEKLAAAIRKPDRRTKPLQEKPRAGRGSPAPALDPTAGLPNTDEGTQQPDNAKGDQRRAQNNDGAADLVQFIVSVRHAIPKDWIVEQNGLGPGLSIDRRVRIHGKHFREEPDVSLYFTTGDWGIGHELLGASRIGFAYAIVREDFQGLWPDVRKRIVEALPKGEPTKAQPAKKQRPGTAVEGRIVFENGSAVTGVTIDGTKPVSETGEYQVEVEPNWDRIYFDLLQVKGWPTAKSWPREKGHKSEFLNVWIGEQSDSKLRRDIRLDRTQFRTVKLLWKGAATAARIMVDSYPSGEWLATHKEPTLFTKPPTLRIGRELEMKLQPGETITLPDVAPGDGALSLTILPSKQILVWKLHGDTRDEQLEYDPRDTGDVEFQVTGQNEAPIKRSVSLHLSRIMPRSVFGLTTSALYNPADPYRPVFDPQTDTYRIQNLQPGKYQLSLFVDSRSDTSVPFTVRTGETTKINVPMPTPRVERGSPDPAIAPTAGLPNSDEATNQPNDNNGDLRSNPVAGSGDPRRSQIDAGLTAAELEKLIQAKGRELFFGRMELSQEFETLWPTKDQKLEKVTSKGTVRWLKNARLTRIDSDRMIPGTGTTELHPEQWTTGFDGVQAYSWNRAAKLISYGAMRPGVLDYSPNFLFWGRTAIASPQPVFGTSPEITRVTRNGREEIDVVVIHDVPGAKFSVSYLGMASDRGCLPTRVEQRSQGRLETLTEFQNFFQPHPGVWVPKTIVWTAWSTDNDANGKPIVAMSSKFTVTKLELGDNAKLQDEEFQLNLPADVREVDAATANAARDANGAPAPPLAPIAGLPNEVFKPLECDIVDAVTGKLVAETKISHRSYKFIKPKSGDVPEKQIELTTVGVNNLSRLLLFVPDEIMRRADRDELLLEWRGGSDPVFENYETPERIPLKQLLSDDPKSGRDSFRTIKLTPKQQPKPAAAGDPRRVKAIEQAIAFLKAQQQVGGAWQGELVDGVTALAAAALLQAGVKADDPVLQKALTHLRTVEPTMTYTVALQTMVFCGASPKVDAELIRRNVAWLEKAQVTTGQSRGAWSYGVDPGGRGDGSCSRFAVLGLDAAKQAGFAVQEETWRRVSDYWLTNQKENGGWGYTPEAQPTLTMTLAGIAGLTTANRHLPRDEQSQKRKAAILKPEKFIEKSLSDLPKATFVLYAFQSLERAGHLSDIARFGELDWQAFATKKLLETQHPNGFWKSGSESEVIATSLALLTLTGQPEPKANNAKGAPQSKPAARSEAPRRSQMTLRVVPVDEAKADYNKLVEANRQQPGSVSGNELLVAKIRWEWCELHALQERLRKEGKLLGSGVESELALKRLEWQKATSDVSLRYAKASADVAKAELDKILEANRRIPSTVPETEVARARITAELGELQVDREQRAFDGEDVTKLDIAIVHKWVEVLKLELEKMLDANRRVPGTIPKSEVARTQIKLDVAELNVTKAEQIAHGESTTEVEIQILAKEVEAAKAEYERLLEANRKSPNVIPAAMLEVTNLKLELAEKRLQLAKKQREFNRSNPAKGSEDQR